MTIIFLTRKFYPSIGGVETHVLQLGKVLIKKGYKVLVISEYLEQVGADQDIVDLEKAQGFEIVRVKAGKDDWFKKFRVWRAMWRLRTYIMHADVVHCHDVFFWYLPFRFVYPFKKVYTTFHGYETKFPLSKKAIIIRKISELMSNGNICVGEYIKKWYGTKADFVTYGGAENIKDQISKTKKSIRKLKIVLIGRLEEDIGIKTYIDTLENLKKSGINFTFEAYGEGTMEKKLAKYGKAFGFTKNIYKVIETADIVFVSSYLTMMQALAAKKNVIAVYENPLKEDYLKLSPFAKYSFICKDADEVFAVIESIRNSPWKNAAMIENGYKWATQQTWDRVAEIYLKLWKI